jgi:hypothetical protein
MDVERTMEFILQRQVKAEGQMAAIRKLIHAGMRMIVKQGENVTKLAAAQKETEVKLRDLAAAQRVTETKLQGLIDSLRRGGNGSHPKK